MAGCSNESPCVQPDRKWPHSPVCQKLTEQGAKLRKAKQNAMLTKARIDHSVEELRDKVARYAHVGGRVEADGSVTQTVKHSDLPDLADALADVPSVPPYARARIGCACGQEWVPSRIAEYAKDGVVHRYGNPCYVEGGPKTVAPPVRAPGRAATPEPPPKTGSRSRPVVPDLVRLLQERRDFGERKYGVELHTENGRDAYLDALQELLDLFVYLHQAQMEHHVLGSRELTYRLNLERRLAALRAGEKVNGEAEFLEELLRTAKAWEG